MEHFKLTIKNIISDNVYCPYKKLKKKQGAFNCQYK